MMFALPNIFATGCVFLIFMFYLRHHNALKIKILQPVFYIFGIYLVLVFAQMFCSEYWYLFSSIFIPNHNSLFTIFIIYADIPENEYIKYFAPEFSLKIPNGHIVRRF